MEHYSVLAPLLLDFDDPAVFGIVRTEATEMESAGIEYDAATKALGVGAEGSGLRITNNAITAPPTNVNNAIEAMMSRSFDTAFWGGSTYFLASGTFFIRTSAFDDCNVILAAGASG